MAASKPAARWMDYFRSWLGRARLTFTHHERPATVEYADGRRETLLKLVEDATPPCQLNPFLFNGHLQTFWTALKEARDIPVYYKRHIFEADQPEYAGTFAVDFVVAPYEGNDESLPPRTTYYTKDEFEALGHRPPEAHTGFNVTGAEALADDDSRPMLICLHGLTGGSYETYLRAVLEPLVKAGWAACVVNSRGCANSKITSGFLYNARATWDCRQMVKWCRKTWPKRKLYGIGFSLGANMMANYVGEEADKCLLEAAVVCSNPWTLEVGNLGLQRTWLGKEIYSKTMGRNLRNLVATHAEMLSKNPRIDLDRIASTKYLHEFDRALQAPCWGYPTVTAYYRDASSTDAVNDIRIPFLAIHAEDDPIALDEAVPYEEFTQNPLTILLTTAMGGHLGSFEFDGGRWFAKPASNFLIRMANDVVKVDKIPPPPANTTEGASISNKAPLFSSTRHKLRMPGIN